MNKKDCAWKNQFPWEFYSQSNYYKVEIVLLAIIESMIEIVIWNIKI